MKDMEFKPSDYKLLSKATLMRQGIDPFNTDNWRKVGEMKWGGRITFKEKVDAVAGSLEGSKVKPKYQKTYGKKYDKAEAMAAAKKIIGSRKAK